MAIKRNVSGVATDITVLKRREAGAWVDMLAEDRALRLSGGSWVDLLPGTGTGGLSLSVSRTSSTGTFSCNDPTTPPFVCPTVKTVTTATVTALAEGGTGTGPTYLWEYVSGDMGFTPSAPTSAATYWSANLPQNVLKSAVWRCTATRGVDSVSTTITVQASYTRTGGGIES